jgi:hypothetical protein
VASQVSRTGTSTEKLEARGPAVSVILPSIEERGRGRGGGTICTVIEAAKYMLYKLNHNSRARSVL